MSWAIWITGLPGSGKSTIARAAARELASRGDEPAVLELDVLRKVLTPAPAYTDAERDVVYRALVYLATTLTESGVPVIIDATGHRRVWRDLARASIARFAEVQLLCPLEVCRERESSRVGTHAPRGIYAAAGRPGATVPGVDVPYEAAACPELTVDTTTTDVATAAARVAALASDLARSARPALAPRRPAWAIWITGLPGSGKTTIASAVLERLEARGLAVRLLEYAEVRAALVPGPSLRPGVRDVLYRTLACAAGLLAHNGVAVLVDAAAPRRAWRDLARRLVPSFAEVQLVCPPEVAAARERAVRWSLAPCPAPGRRKATADEEPELAAEYEPALAPELTIRTDERDPWSAAEEVLRLAERLQRSARDSTFTVTVEETTMRVSDLMTRDLITVRPDTPVFEARALMLKQRIRHLLVTEGDRLAGLVTDRDIRLNLPSPATSLSVWEVNHLLARLTVGEVMTRSVITVEPHRDAREAALIMLDHRIGALPVLDGQRLVGILTETDLVRAFARSATPAAAAVPAAR